MTDHEKILTALIYWLNSDRGVYFLKTPESARFTKVGGASINRNTADEPAYDEDGELIDDGALLIFPE